MTKVRTRLAPSPTGELHIGSLRGFLYNYAHAKKNGGSMVLRIEDTDKAREVKGAVSSLMSTIRAYGLDWDEGLKMDYDTGTIETVGDYGPYLQSKRLDLYKKYASQLIEKNHAYYCFCSSERLNDLRERQKKEKIPPKYDKKCLNLDASEVEKRLANKESHVIRLNVPKNEIITWNDLILGEISINTNDIDDQVLIKSDGFPTYHLAVVVDDHLMKINPVLRGQEWVPSTPKQILLYKMFDWEIPDFGHLPLLKEAGSSQKMSKRFGNVHASKFLQDGYLPEAVLNFLMFLGWNPGTDKEIYSLEEFVNDFSIEKIHKTDLVSFDRDKLLWFNSKYIRFMDTKELLKRIIDFNKTYSSQDFAHLLKEKINTSEDTLLYILDLVKERMQTLAEFEDLITYFFADPHVDEKLLVSYTKDKTRTQAILSAFVEAFSKIKNENWNVSVLDRVGHEILDAGSYKPKEAFMTVRVAVSGRSATPPLFEMLFALGKKITLKRLKNSI